MAAGYVAIGFDHFALPDDPLAVALREGRLDRSFMGYTPHQGLPVVGVGMSAISAVDGHFVQQTAHLGRWWRAVEAGEAPVQRAYVSDRADRIRADIIRGILCDLQLDFATIDQRWSVAFEEAFGEELGRLAPLIADGLVTHEDRRLAITDRGRRFARVVAMAFDPAAQRPDGGRYSRVV